MKKPLFFFLKLLLSLALIGYLLTLVDITATLRRFQSMEVRYVAIAAGLLLAQFALSTLKWKLILRADEIVTSYWFLLKTYMIGGFVNLFLPTGFGGDIYRVLALNSASKNVIKSASSVLFDRLTGLFALVSIACIAYIMLPGSDYDWVVIALYATGIVLFYVGTTTTVVMWLENFSSRFVRKLSGVVKSLHTYKHSGRTLLFILAISFLFQFNIVVINKLYSTALGIDIPFSYLLVIIPLIYLTEMLPISINGIGVRESAFVFFFTLIGFSSDQGFAVSLLVISMRYIVGLLGGALLMITLLQSKRRRS